MLTIIESPLFTKQWPDYWTEDERLEFASYLSKAPDSGQLIPDPVVAEKYAGPEKVKEKVVVSGGSIPLI